MSGEVRIFAISGGMNNGIDPLYLSVLSDLMGQVSTSHVDWWTQAEAGNLTVTYRFNEDAQRPRVTWRRAADGPWARLVRAPVWEGASDPDQIASSDVSTILDSVRSRFRLGPYPVVASAHESMARAQEHERQLRRSHEQEMELLHLVQDRLPPWLVESLESQKRRNWRAGIAGAIDRHIGLEEIPTTAGEEELLNELLRRRWTPASEPFAPPQRLALMDGTSGADLLKYVESMPAYDPRRDEDSLGDSDHDELPTAHQAFAAHFTDPLYSDPAGEFAPSGTDEGYELLQSFATRQQDLPPTTTLAWLLTASGLDDMVSQLDVDEPGMVPEPGGQVDAATFIVAAGFTLLRLTGHIDEEGKGLTLRALDVLVNRYGAPEELIRQREDLLSWKST